METKGHIGIPKALMYYRFFPFWQIFFERLGWKVSVSDGIGRKGKILYFEDSCLPMKLLVTHAIQLKDQVDHLFVPRLVSLHRKYMMCPKFRGAPDIVRLATEETVSIIDETIDLREKEHSLPKAFLRVGKRLGASQRETEKAFSEAQQRFIRFQSEWMDRLHRLPSRQLFDLNIQTPGSPGGSAPSGKGEKARNDLKRGDRERRSDLKVALIGHPYNLFDTDINKDILALIRRMEIDVFTSDLLSEEEIDQEISDLSKEIYWSSGREIVGSLFHYLKRSVDGVIFVTSFKCGIDALLQEFIRRRLKLQQTHLAPFLSLSFDEHTGREGLVTRLEAFREVMEQRRREKI